MYYFKKLKGMLPSVFSLVNNYPNSSDYPANSNILELVWCHDKSTSTNPRAVFENWNFFDLGHRVSFVA